MELHEQLTEAEVEEGLVLSRLMEHEDFWPAIQAVVKRIENDAVHGFLSDEKKGRKWLKGYLEAIRSVVPAIATKATDSETVIQEYRDQVDTVRSRAEDGQGSGDLSL